MKLSQERMEAFNKIPLNEFIEETAVVINNLGACKLSEIFLMELLEQLVERVKFEYYKESK